MTATIAHSSTHRDQIGIAKKVIILIILKVVLYDGKMFFDVFKKKKLPFNYIFCSFNCQWQGPPSLRFQSKLQPAFWRDMGYWQWSLLEHRAIKHLMKNQQLSAAFSVVMVKHWLALTVKQSKEKEDYDVSTKEHNAHPLYILQGWMRWMPQAAQLHLIRQVIDSCYCVEDYCHHVQHELMN